MNEYCKAMEEGDQPFQTRTAFARGLRNDPTRAEKLLWKLLSNSKIGYKFTRQQPIGIYFADFCCRQRRLIIELDGYSHLGQQEADLVRSKFLEDQGYRIVRFCNDRVISEFEDVISEIRTA